MSSRLSERFLLVYSGVLTVVFAATVLCAFSAHKNNASFDEIDVHRINVVEPDGTLRMVISNEDKFPGVMIKGKEYPHPDRKTAGELFFDNEGTEDGGLIYGSSLDQNGKLSEAYVHMSFDRYRQDQALSLDESEEGTNKKTTLRINDLGDYSIMEAIEAEQRISKLPADQRGAEWKKFAAAHPGNHARIVLGRTEDKAAILQLKDTEGRNRIVLEVAPDGTPSIALLDAQGHVAKRMGIDRQP